MSRDRWISLIEWGVILGACLADVVLGRVTGISMDVSAKGLEMLAVLALMWPLIALLTRMTGFAKGSEVLAENTVKFFIFVFAASALEYYLAVNPAPLNDDLLIKMDGMLGFSWPPFFDWMSGHKLIVKILGYAYFSLEAQVWLALLVVGIVYPRRSCRFITASLVSGLLSLLIFAFFPVAGPFAYFHHTDLPQASYTEHYQLMRAHALAAIPMDHLRGIVSFPSFHVSSAVILTYFFRRLSVFFWLAVAVNVCMTLAALVIGGHYLSDIIAGVIVGVITIDVVRRVETPATVPLEPSPQTDLEGSLS